MTCRQSRPIHLKAARRLSSSPDYLARQGFALTGRIRRPSGHQFFDHLAAGLARLFEATFMEVGELVAVETEKVQEGDVEVTNVVDFFDGLAAEVVRGADGLAGDEGREGG